MAEVHKTRDPNIWFNARNFRETVGGPVRQALVALVAGQPIRLSVNGEIGMWNRFLGTPLPLALRANSAEVRERWNAVQPGAWVSIELVAADPAAGAEALTHDPVPRQAEIEIAKAPIVEPEYDPGALASAAGDRIVYACDVGSTRIQRKTGTGNFGWARLNLTQPNVLVGSRSIERLVEALLADMRVGCRLALGFESPLFLPIPIDSSNLSRRREGENNRSWSAPVGAAVTTLGVHQAAWLLRSLVAEGPKLGYVFSTEWQRWNLSDSPLLLVWEAFISNDAHSRTNDPIEDAASAVLEFSRCEMQLHNANAVKADPRISLIHAAALWAGWESDVSLLSSPTLVLKPRVRSDRVVQSLEANS